MEESILLEYEKADREAERAKFAIECRAIRLHLASHPGLTEAELGVAFGYPVENHLDRLEQLGMVIMRTKCRKKLPPKDIWFVQVR